MMCRRRKEGTFLSSHPTKEEYFEGQALNSWVQVLTERGGLSDEEVAKKAAKLAELSAKERFHNL